MKRASSLATGLTALFLFSTSAAANEITEEPRFLDDQKVVCTGEASVPGYSGPCGRTLG